MLKMYLQFFGGRGASSGVSDAGREYGTEYTTLYSSDEILFVRYNDANSAKSPMETMTKGRIYVTVNKKNELKYITRYDENNKRYMQIDLSGRPHKVNGEDVLPHTHYGYWHYENGTKEPSPEDNALIDRVKKIWYKHINGD